jgi:hypothetical protein
MHTGSVILFRICCPECGTVLPSSQPQNSDFFIFECGNSECGMSKASVLVERRTGIVLSINQYEFRDYAGQWYRPVMEKIKKEGS